MKHSVFVLLYLLGQFLTAFVRSKVTVIISSENDNSSKDPKCNSAAKAISEVKDELVELKDEMRLLKEKGLENPIPVNLYMYRKPTICFINLRHLTSKAQ